MKFNLQYFAQVQDAFGKELVEKNKKKIIPVITPPKVVNKPVVPTVTPVVAEGPRDLAARPFTRDDPGTYEEGVAFRATQQAQAEAQAQDAAKLATVPTQAVPTVPTGPTPEEIVAQKNAELVARSKKQAIDSLLRGFNISQGRLDQEEGAIAGDFRTKEANVRTRDTMARAGKGKFLDIGGLGKAGQVGQTALAQNVITGGAIGQLNQQELAQRADIQRRRTELITNREQGIADINAAIELQEIESSLRSAEAQAEYQREKEVLQESREYDDYLRQVELADDREIALFEQELLERNKALDFEIEEAQANNDSVRLLELTQEKAALDLQELAVRQAGDRRLESQRQAGRVDLEAQKQAGREALQTDNSGTTSDTYRPNISTINASLTNALGDTEGLSDEKIKDRTLEWIVGKSDVFMNDPDLLLNVLTRNNISPEELEEYETWRDRALNSQ